MKLLKEAWDNLREICEIYAGMEGFIPETAPEGYQQRIIKQMYDAAAKNIARIGALLASGGQHVIQPDEILVAIKRPEGYEDVHPDLLAHDCFRDFVEYRIIAAAPLPQGDKK